MNIINDLFLSFLLSSIPAAFNYFLDYCLGHPMSDKVSIKAIFFPYSYWLARKALPKSKERELLTAFSAMLDNDSPDIRKNGKDQLKLSIMTAGREYFTYQQAFGMCPFCTNFWVSLAAAAIYYFSVPLSFINPLFFFIMTPLFSHSILRKI